VWGAPTFSPPLPEGGARESKPERLTSFLELEKIDLKTDNNLLNYTL
jgi:hypothetical protein